MSILDQTLDDLADLPSNKPFPDGAHWVQFYFDINMKNKDRPQPYIKMEYLEVLELTDPQAEAPKPGDQSTIFYHLFNKEGQRNEFGEGQVKQVLNMLKGHGLEITSIKSAADLLAKNGVKAAVVLKVRPAKGEYAASQALENIVELG